MRHFACAAVLSGLLFLAACGGSGGGDDGVGLGTFSGNYFLVMIGGTEGTPKETVMTQGLATADGAGLVSVTGFENATGSILLLVPVGFEYEIDGAANFSWLNFGTPFLRGGIRTSGSAAILGRSATSSDPGIAMLVRRSSGHSTSMVDGSYHGTNVGLFTSSGDSACVLYDVSFDGLGAWSSSPVLGNVEGAFPAFVGTSGSYAVTGNGSMIFSSLGVDFNGGIDASGEFVVLGGGGSTGDSSLATVLIPFSTTASTALLAGEYWIAGFGKDAAPSTSFASFEGTLTADGAGMLSFSGTQNLEGVNSLASFFGTYSVIADGSATGTFLGTGWEGAVSPSGTYAFFGGGTSGGSDPMLFVLMRK